MLTSDCNRHRLSPNSILNHDARPKFENNHNNKGLKTSRRMIGLSSEFHTSTYQKFQYLSIPSPYFQQQRMTAPISVQCSIVGSDDLYLHAFLPSFIFDSQREGPAVETNKIMQIRMLITRHYNLRTHIHLKQENLQIDHPYIIKSFPKFL